MFYELIDLGLKASGLKKDKKSEQKKQVSMDWLLNELDRMKFVEGATNKQIFDYVNQFYETGRLSAWYRQLIFEGGYFKEI